MRLRAWLLALLLLPAVGLAAPSPKALSADMLARLHAARPGATIMVRADAPLVLLIKGDGGLDQGAINLDGLYGYCAQAIPADCEAAKTNMVQRLLKPRPTPRAEDLRLIVRDQQYVDDLVGRVKGDRSFYAIEPLGERLYLLLAVDSPDTIAVVTRVSLKALGLGRDEAWAQALRQTKAILPSLPTAAGVARDPVVYEDQEYLPALLIDRQAWAKLAEEVGPDLFVTLVSDHYVFVGKGGDGPELERFKASVRQDCAEQERCITPDLYRFRNGSWVISR